MRIQTRDLASKERVNMWEVVPLAHPWTIYIDVTNRCNFACQYCPTGNPAMLKVAQRKAMDMPMETFKKIIHDMGQFPGKVKNVNLYKDGEPLVHPHFLEMVRMMRDADVCENIFSKTNGQAIGDIPDLAAAPLDLLGISVSHVNSDGFYKIGRKRVDYDKYKDDIKRLFEDSRRKFKIHAKIARYDMTDDDIEKFFTDFEPIVDTCALEGLHGWGGRAIHDTFLEDIGFHDGTPYFPKIACPLPFYTMSVSSNGITNVCCAEWGNWHNLGDVNKESLLEIFTGEKTKAFQVMHLEGRRHENVACKDCKYRESLPDYIDDHRDEMIRKITNA